MPLTDTTNNTPKRCIQLDDYTCGLMIGRFQADQSIADIQLTMSIPRSTIVGCVHLWRETVLEFQRHVKESNLSCMKETNVRLYAGFREEPFMSFVAHKDKLKTAGVDIHRQTLSKYATINGFSSYSPAKDKVKWTPEKWENVIWSDEPKFNVQDCKIWERFSHDLGVFWAGGLGPLVVMKGIINQEAYIDCLSNHFLPWLNNITAETSKNFIFQEDGACCHTGTYAIWYKTRCGVDGFVFWPAQSPDLNPIERVWAYLERRIEGRRYQIKNINQLEAALRDEWYDIPKTFLEKLVGSMNSRCKAVIEAKGGNTKY
ncbi:hypothetical protein INT47_012475 [Mucor saturninus]|uniref:Tc1-like transposase DDE domain-containing protein n=1 Tax=Mucor saturninus TaxID=64648 RepID=A0A8H7UV93_9FUNG|nr:hypothetical protein INT47_012475 [Mucor saturninus]